MPFFIAEWIPQAKYTENVNGGSLAWNPPFFAGCYFTAPISSIEETHCCQFGNRELLQRSKKHWTVAWKPRCYIRVILYSPHPETIGFQPARHGKTHSARDPAESANRIDNPVHFLKRHSVQCLINFRKISFDLVVIHPIDITVCFIEQRQDRFAISKIQLAGCHKGFQRPEIFFHVRNYSVVLKKSTG